MKLTPTSTICSNLELPPVPAHDWEVIDSIHEGLQQYVSPTRRIYFLVGSNPRSEKFGRLERLVVQFPDGGIDVWRYPPTLEKDLLVSQVKYERSLERLAEIGSSNLRFHEKVYREIVLLRTQYFPKLFS